VALAASAFLFLFFMKFLIVGLGNPGAEYAATRHNIGFMVLDAWVEKAEAGWKTERYGEVARIKTAGRTVVLLKPSTFMNLSGNAVRYWLQAEKIEVENLLVITDDLALPFGKLRLKGKGSDGGHNGLKHIQATLNTQEYARLRFGIGSEFAKGHQIDFVLGEFSEQEKEVLSERTETAIEGLKLFTIRGLAHAMNMLNK